MERAIFSAADLLIFAWDWGVEPIADAVERMAPNTRPKHILLIKYIYAEVSDVKRPSRVAHFAPDSGRPG